MIEWIEVESFSHATEDDEKVLDALACLPDLEFEEKKLEGHYGNPIKMYKAHIEDDGAIENFLSLFDRIERNTLESIEERVDEKGRFHLRINKQRLYAGEYVVDSEGDVHITIKIVTYPLKRKKVIKNVKEILGD